MNTDALARSVQEAGNLLATFLCAGALGKLREKGTAQELNALVARTLAAHGPAFRGMHALAKGAPDVEVPLERLEVLTRLGLRFDAPRELAELRAAIRQLLASVGFEVPLAARRERAVCELHGAACPLAPQRRRR
jgi:hypothetical protein